MTRLRNFDWREAAAAVAFAVCVTLAWLVFFVVLP